MNYKCGRVDVLVGLDNGRYPQGNSVLVRGRNETVLIDPSLSLAQLSGVPAEVDRILVSHSHEDHLAGLHLFPEAAVQAHASDLLGIHALDGLRRICGYPAPAWTVWEREICDRFQYQARPDATPFADGASFDVGGEVITVIHLPGHTRGHCAFLMERSGVLYIGDIDLTGFGPYYGDAWSDLPDFEASLARCASIDAACYVTFHHKGVVRNREIFRSMLADYRSVIWRRELALLEFLVTPHSMDEVVARRFVYRSHVNLPFVDAAERRSMEQHLSRLILTGSVISVAPDVYSRL